MRSMSRAMALCTGFRRGWAALAMRSSAASKADTKGCALPVRLACWMANRRPDSMSSTSVSSLERDTLSISSSSWVRCKLTSESLTSATANRACNSCVRASVRSTISLERLLCSVTVISRRASSCWMRSSRCHIHTAINKASAATATAPLSNQPAPVPVNTGAEGAVAEAVMGAGDAAAISAVRPGKGASTGLAAAERGGGADVVMNRAGF